MRAPGLGEAFTSHCLLLPRGADTISSFSFPHCSGGKVSRQENNKDLGDCGGWWEMWGKLRGAPCVLGWRRRDVSILRGLGEPWPGSGGLSRGAEALALLPGSWLSQPSGALGLAAPPPQGPLYTLCPQTKQPTGLPQPQQKLEEGQLIGPPLLPHPTGLPFPTSRSFGEGSG